MSWNTVPSDAVIAQTITALKANGIDAEVVDNAAAAKDKALSLLPPQAAVMNMTSVTLDTTGISQEIMESGKYQPVKKTLMSLHRETDSLRMQELGAAPPYAIGSVHAVTEDGKLLIASNTGSQLPAYVYGAAHVIFVVGAQKIVPNLDAGMQRLYEYTLPLESERARQAYGTDGSFVSKLLIINREVAAHRLHLIFIKENIGF